MHIPDGYLSPQTFVPLIRGIICFLGNRSEKIKKGTFCQVHSISGNGSSFFFSHHDV